MNLNFLNIFCFDLFTRNWLKQIDRKTKPSLIKAIAKTFWREYLMLGFIQFFNDIVIRLTQPLFLGWLLNYFSPGSTTTRNSAFGHAGALVALSAISAITINQYILGSFVNGMKVRLATCSLIYRKSLRLSSTALGNTSVGKVVNLLSNDVSRFDIVSVFLHSMWLAPLLSIIVGILLYREVGVPGIIGMVVIAIVTPIQSYTGKLSSIFRLQTALRTDERVSNRLHLLLRIFLIAFFCTSDLNFVCLKYFVKFSSNFFCNKSHGWIFDCCTFCLCNYSLNILLHNKC
jgi:ATP-binding cassette, subfamily C (CFTR/MRP), member 4